MGRVLFLLYREMEGEKLTTTMTTKNKKKGKKNHDAARKR